MSWFDRRILTERDVQQGTAAALPSFLQVGQAAKLWIFDEQGQPKSIPCKVCGVDIEGHHAVRYNLAFKIEGTDLYARIDDFRGYVTDEATVEIDRNGGLVDAEQVQEQLELGTRLLGR